ncbi:MAG: hypothetical protein ACK5D5_06605 [Bacteroidota bacterium]|jgi:hypothetical protein
MKKTIVYFKLLITILLYSPAFSQSGLSQKSPKITKKIELRYINKTEVDKISSQIELLRKNLNEKNLYFIDKNHNVFFLLNDKKELLYYCDRMFTDNDLVNKTSKDVYYMITNDPNLENKSDFFQINFEDKEIIMLHN